MRYLFIHLCQMTGKYINTHTQSHPTHIQMNTSRRSIGWESYNTYSYFAPNQDPCQDLSQIPFFKGWYVEESISSLRSRVPCQRLSQIPFFKGWYVEESISSRVPCQRLSQIPFFKGWYVEESISSLRSRVPCQGL
jgi:hypothetical protein